MTVLWVVDGAVFLLLGSITFLLLLLPIGLDSIALELLRVAANAVLIPIAPVQGRRRQVLDFDRGTLALDGHLDPAAAFLAGGDTVRHPPEHARMLRLRFATGTIELQVRGFRSTTTSRERDPTLMPFVVRSSQLPPSHRSVAGDGIGTCRELIGRQDVAQLLS